MADSEQVSEETLQGEALQFNTATITGRVYATIFELLEQHPEGIRWVDLNARVGEKDPSFHPKTINGCVWKLVERYPDQVYKPSKGLFRLLKYKDTEEETP